jgi:hypothetical protein
VLPGVHWVKWEPKFLPNLKADGKAESVADTIKAHLDKLQSGGVEKVSLMKLKADLKLGETNRKTVQRATQKAVESTRGAWVLHGKSVWQASVWLFGEAG